jgi:adenylylsulfate kinase
VVWITGLSGVGKTTLAVALRDALGHKDGKRPVIIDGDQIRAVLDEPGYDLSTRKRLAFVYSRLARHLASQGFDVIVATISLFHDVHRWNRESLPGYFEILLGGPLERKVNGSHPPTAADWVGVDQTPEWPHEPDLCLKPFDDANLPRILERLTAHATALQTN